MIQRFTCLAVLVSGCLFANRVATAESWPGLDDLASPRFLLIVHCRTEEVDGRVLYKVLDVFKGEYSPLAFEKQPPTGYIDTPGPGGGYAAQRPAGDEAILFYTRGNQSKAGISRHDMTVPVRDGKLTYPSGKVELFSGQREYTLTEFKREITSRIEGSAAKRPETDGLAETPILSLMIEKADAVARVKAFLACRVLRLGEEVCVEYLHVIEPLKGAVKPGQQLLPLRYTRRTIDDAGEPLPDPGMRLPVENGKEYIVFLRAAKPDYVLLDPWAGALVYRPELAQLIRRETADRITNRPANGEVTPDGEPSTAAPEIDRLNDKGFSKLHYAAIAGNLDAARQLLEQGADANVRQGTYRGTPLQYAAAGGHIDVVRLLLKHNADVNSADSGGRTPLMWAAKQGRADIVQELLKAGADPDPAAMIEKADVIARVKAVLVRVSDEAGVNRREYLQVIDPLKGPVKRDQRLLDQSYLDKFIYREPQMRLPVENGKEYLIFLKQTPDGPKPGYTLLDPWAGVLPYDPQLAKRVPQAVEAGIHPERDGTLLSAHSGPMASVAFAPDGRLLATAAMHERGGHAPNLVKLWNPETGELRRTLNPALGDPPIDDVISAVVFSPDGGKLAVSGGVLYHGNVVVFDVKTGKLEWSHQDVADTTDVGIAFSPDGRRLASTGVLRDGGGARRKQLVNLWDVATGKLERSLDSQDGYLMSVAFAPDGRTLAAASSNGAVVLWDLQTGEARRRLLAADHDPRASGYVSVVFAPDGKRLAVSHSDGALRLWNPEDGTLERELPLGKRRPHTIAFSPDGKLLGSVNWVEESVSLWSVRTGKELAVIPKERGGGTVFAFSPDGKTLATGSKEGALRLVPIETKKAPDAGPDVTEGRQMKSVLPGCSLVAAVILLAPVSVRAETWPDLETYVDRCVLIVKCKTEIKDKTVAYRVLETWKGQYSPDLFHHKPQQEYLYTGTWHGNEEPTEGREIIFFFTKGNQPAWTKGKLLHHSTAFVVAGGKVVYASTSREGMRKEYTVAGFKKAIIEMDKQLWASIRVSSLVFEKGATGDPFMIHFALENDGNQAVNPELDDSQLLVNGKELKDWRLIVSQGPRDNRWQALPPGDYLLFGYALGKYFEEPGTYNVLWKGKGFESPEIAFRVMPKTERTPASRAKEQIGKLRAVDLSPYSDNGFLDVLPFGKDSSEPTAVLFRMGMDALPLLAEALEDETPTATVTSFREGDFVERKAWKVNELAALLIVRIAERDFVVGKQDEEVGIRDVGANPTAAKPLKQAVLDWHAKFASKTPTERKIADVTDAWFRNRFDAVIWLGNNKAADGRAPIAAHVDAFYADEQRESSSITRAEMSYCALALGQIGDTASLPQVRRVCQDMSYRPSGQRWGTGSDETVDLFRAYRGLALLGKQDEALQELKRLFAAYGAEMEPPTRKEYETRLAEAQAW